MGQLHEELGKVHFEPFAHERCTREMLNVEGKRHLGKRIFPTKADGESFVGFHESEYGAQDCYKCPFFDHWHLTTRSPRPVANAPAPVIAPVATDPVAVQKVIAPVAAGGSTLAPFKPSTPRIPIVKIRRKTLNGWPLPGEQTRAYFVVQIMKLKGDEKTICEIAEECGVSAAYVSSLKSKYHLSCKSVDAQRDRQLKKEEGAAIGRRRQALDKEKPALLPRIDIETDGAILKLYRRVQKLIREQFRALVNEVAKLRIG